MTEIKPVIVAVGYNRPDSLKRLMISLNQAVYPSEDITLIVSIDRSDIWEEVQKAAESTGWKHGTLDIRVAPERLGLRKHILRCGDLSQEYGAAIILEDDLIVARNFYTYVQQALSFYENDPKTAGISLYSHAWNEHMDFHFMPQQNGYDTYFGQFSCTWGQCWSKDQWSSFKNWYLEHEDKLTVNSAIPEDIEHWGDRSWGKYFVYYLVETGRYYVMPYTALSTNCSEIGEHNGHVNATYQVMLMECDHKDYRFPLYQDAVKYDIFFERVFDPAVTLFSISSDDICINLNGSHRDTMNKPYLLTSVKDDRFRLIRSFGMQLRPIEQNILKDIPGSSLYLYQIPSDMKNVQLNVKQNVSDARGEYESYNFGWKRALKYSRSDFIRMIKGIIEG